MLLSRLTAAVAATALMAGSALAQAPAAAPPAAEAPAAAPAPPAEPGPGAVGFKPLPQTNTTDIVATLKAAGEFNTLLAASDKANLTGLLSTRQGLTLFAPTDAALAALPPGTMDDLMKEGNGAKLQQFLLYHLVALKLTKDQIAGKKGPIPTASQKPVEADGSAEPIKLNDAQVLQADVGASNGSIYVIDRVLTPPA
jgi:uncharacterized surface protein with fasciclin (FAS1) repeats